MKREVRAHPLMMLRLMQPFLFILVFPLFRGLIQYLLYRRVSGILGWEIGAFAIVILITLLRWIGFRLSFDGDVITVKSGFLLQSVAVIHKSKLSSVSSTQNPLDALLGAVTYRIDTEAGQIGKPDFEFKISTRDSHWVSEHLYGGENRVAIRFSIFKLAIAAATTSSAVTGLLIGVPVINRVGKLLGVGLSEMLYDEISSATAGFNSYFPPAVNIITAVFIVGYAFSFLYSFLKNLRFKLYMGKEKMEIHSGWFVRRRAMFKKESINDVCIEQTPLMRLFRYHSMRAAVGGYGDAKGEKADVFPCARRTEMENCLSEHLSFLVSDDRVLRAARDRKTLNRFFWLPKRLAFWTITAACLLITFFSYFDRLIFFLSAVALAVICYYADLCYYSYRNGRLCMGDNVFAQSAVGMRTRKLYCEKSRIGIIRILQNPADRRHGTCKVELIVRSQSADKIRVRHLDRRSVCSAVARCYKLETIVNNSDPDTNTTSVGNVSRETRERDV